MKTKTLKPIIISALLAGSFGATAAGTTFALFTDRADTKIDVTAGIVDIETTVKMVSYSDGDLLNDSPVDLTSKESYTTEIGTKFELANEGKDLEITNFVPGDKIELTVSLFNKSNVKTKYRLTASNNAGELAKALKVTATGGAISWTELPVAPEAGEEIETAHVTIEFVNLDEGEILAKEDLAARDNRFMGKTVTYHLGYEVVQGNAHTVDSEPTGFNSYEEVVTPTAAEQGSGYVWEKEVAGGIATLSGETPYNDPVTVTLGTDVENSNFVFEGGSETVSYDIHVNRNAQDTTAVSVKVLLEKDLAGVTIYHEKDNGTVEEVENTYDPLTGYVTFQTSTFSPYHFVQLPKGTDIEYVKTTARFLEKAEEGEDIYLGADLEFTAYIPLLKSVNVYGFGHTISTSATRIARIGTNDINVNLYNLTLDGKSVAQRGLQLDSNITGVTSELKGVTIKNVTHYAVNLCGNSQMKLNIDDSYLTGWAALNLYGRGQIVNVKDSVLEGINNYSGAYNSFCTICLEGDTTLQDDTVYASDYEVNIIDSKVIAKSNTEQVQAILGINNNARNSTVDFEDCEFELGKNNTYFGYNLSDNSNKLIINEQEVEMPVGVYYNIK